MSRTLLDGPSGGRATPAPRGIFVVALVWLACWCAPLGAQLPGARLFAVFPAGGRQGTTVEVTLAGADLDSADQLSFSHPGITAAQKTVEPTAFEMGPQPLANQFLITIAADVPQGLYDVRASGKYGISNPRSFAVGSQPEIVEVEPNNTLATATELALETTVNGRSDGGSDVDYYKFAAQAGQRILCDCQARRIDSRLESSLVVFDAAGRQLERTGNRSRRDALVDFTVPADGEYFVKLHDCLYSGGNEYFYRLSVGSGPYVDFVFPPSGLAGTEGPYTLYGRNLPGGEPAPNITVDGKPLQMLPARIAMPPEPAALALPSDALVEPAESGVDAVVYRLSTPQGAANPVLVSYAAAPVVAEQEPNDAPDQAQKVSPPCEYVGQFNPRHDQDWITFDARQGDLYWIEVFSGRLGVPADPFLLVQQVTTNDKGEEQASDLLGADDIGGNVGGLNYDTTHDDPLYRFVAPADGTYRVQVRDLYFGSRGDPRYVYRLAIRPERPDFRLVAVPRFPGANPDPNQNQPAVWSPLVLRGGTELVEVVAFRRDGFDGEIQISVEGLPAGVTSSVATIGPGQTSGSLVLTAADNAPEAVSTISVVGKARIGDAEVTRQARTAAMVWPGALGQLAARSRMTRNFALAVSAGETAPYLVEAGQSMTWEMSRAGTLQIPVAVTRRGGFNGNVALAAVGLPPNVAPTNIALEGNTASGNIPLNIQPNAPVGTYSFYFLAAAQLAYSRNPEAAQAAAARKAELDKIAADAAAAAKVAADAKAATDQLAVDAAAEAAKAVEAQRAAEKTAADAETKATDAALAAQAAKAAADNDPANKDLADALVAAEKAADDAAALAKTAAEAKAVADSAAADAEVKAKAAAEAKAVADKAAADADAQAKAAAAAKAAADQLAVDTDNAAKPMNRNVGFPSTAVTIKITPAPITLAAPAGPAALKQGMKVEVPVLITRLYGYADPVQLSVALPQGVAGLSIPQLAIPAGQNQATLVVEAAADATPGTHALSVQATATFNNQNLQVVQTVPLTVEQVEKSP